MGNAQQIPKRDLEDWKRKYNCTKKQTSPPPQLLLSSGRPQSRSLLSSLISPTSAAVPKDKVDLTFRAFNSQKGKNGQITKEKFLDVMTKEGAAEREFAEAIFESFDKDSSGCVVALPLFATFLLTSFFALKYDRCARVHGAYGRILRWHH